MKDDHMFGSRGLKMTASIYVCMAGNIDYHQIKVFGNSDFSKVRKRNICEVTGSSGPCRLVTFGCGFTGAVGSEAFLPVF